MTMLTLTTGTAFIMWLGEQITERGIGNGMSLLIFTGIVVGSAAARSCEIVSKVQTGDWPLDPGGHHCDHDGRGGRDSSCWWSAASAAFRCNTPSA